MTDSEYAKLFADEIWANWVLIDPYEEDKCHFCSGVDGKGVAVGKKNGQYFAKTPHHHDCVVLKAEAFLRELKLRHRFDNRDE